MARGVLTRIQPPRTPSNVETLVICIWRDFPLVCPILANAGEVLFVYTGVGEGAVVPQDVVRVRIDPSVLAISAEAFELLQKLENVQLHESLHLIGEEVFFYCTALKEVQLSDGVKQIGQSAFAYCKFTKFRSPPLVTIIPVGMLEGCINMFSLELPEHY